MSWKSCDSMEEKLKAVSFDSFTSDAKCTSLLIILQAKVFNKNRWSFLTCGYANEMRSVVYRAEAENLGGLLSDVSGRKSCKQRSLLSNANIY